MPYDDVPLQRDAAVMLLWEAAAERLCFEFRRCSQSFFLNYGAMRSAALQFQHEFFFKKKVLWRTVGLYEVFLEGFCAR
jgi:hypothetical protein